MHGHMILDILGAGVLTYLSEQRLLLALRAVQTPPYFYPVLTREAYRVAGRQLSIWRFLRSVILLRR